MEDFKSVGGTYHVLRWNEEYSNKTLTLVECLGSKKCSTIFANKPESDIATFLVDGDSLVISPCGVCPKKCHRIRNGHEPVSKEELMKIKENLWGDFLDQDEILEPLVQENDIF